MGGKDDPDWSVVFGAGQPRIRRETAAERACRLEERRQRLAEVARQRARERENMEAEIQAELERRFARKFRDHPWIDDPDTVAGIFAEFESQERENVVNELCQQNGWDRRRLRN